MGALLAKFKKEKTTAEVLEGLEEKINEIEKYSLNTQERKKRFVNNFLAISIGLFVIAIIIYLFYLPSAWKERIIYAVPLILFPLVIILLPCKLFSWHFQRKLNNNSNKLSALRAEKKKILEQVMDKETYKVAVNLLTRFGDKTNGTRFSYSMTPRVSGTSNTSSTSLPSSMRALATTTTGNQLSVSSAAATNVRPSPTTPRQLTFTSQMGQSPVRKEFTTTNQLALTPRADQQLRRRTPFPVVNQQSKGVFDRIVDVLIGDGPQDRFAMICKECFAHNGMALKEDFEYTTFRCAFCNALNPSRKARPVAPRLSIQPHHIASKHSSDSSSSTSDDDSDREHLKRHHEVPQIELTETPIASSANEKSDIVLTYPIQATEHDDFNDNDEIVAAAESEPMLNKDELHQKQTIDMSKLQDEFKKLMQDLEQEPAENENEKKRLEEDLTN